MPEWPTPRQHGMRSISQERAPSYLRRGGTRLISSRRRQPCCVVARLRAHQSLDCSTIRLSPAPFPHSRLLLARSRISFSCQQRLPLNPSLSEKSGRRTTCRRQLSRSLSLRDRLSSSMQSQGQSQRSRQHQAGLLSFTRFQALWRASRLYLATPTGQVTRFPGWLSLTHPSVARFRAVGPLPGR